MRICPLLALLVGCAPPSGEPPASDATFELSRLPGFSWVRDGQLAGMPQPGAYGDLYDDLDFLVDEGIDLLITVNESPPSDEALAKIGLEGAWWPVEDFQPPEQQQLTEYVAAVQAAFDDGRAVGVHCTAGRGRTGTFLAAWFVWEGLGAEAAIAEIRSLRPGSIETVAQEDAVRIFAGELDPAR